MHLLLTLLKNTIMRITSVTLMTLLAVTLLVPLLASINITLALTTMNTTVFIFYKIQIYIC